MSPTRRRAPAARRRAPARRTIRAERFTFRNVQIAFGSLSVQSAGTASALTNLTDVVEALPAPDFELNRARLTFVRGRCAFRPTDTTPMSYSYGLFIGPDTLDAADIDPALAGVQGKPYWAVRNLLLIPDEIQPSEVGDTTRAYRCEIRTVGTRRLHGFGESLWFAESLTAQALETRGWSFDIGVELG